MNRHVRIGDSVGIIGERKEGTGWIGDHLIEDIDVTNEGSRITVINRQGYQETIIHDRNGIRLDSASSNYSGSAKVIYDEFDPDFLEKYPQTILRRVLRNRLNQHIQDVPDTYAFSGEGDSSQTEFERLSNNMEIGVHVPESLIIPALFVLEAHTINNWDLMKSFLDYGVEPDDEEYPKDGDFLDFVSWPIKSQFDDYGTSGPVLSQLYHEVNGPQGVYRVYPNSETKIYTLSDLIDLAFRDLETPRVKPAGRR